jgi:hypothetical protein
MNRRDFLLAAAAASALPFVARAQPKREGFNTYYVSPTVFADAYKDYNFEPIHKAMGQLIDRYDIKKKRVIALGAGSLFEERYFVELGHNELIVVEIDWYGSAEPLLKISKPGPVKYVVGDALLYEPEEHDVLYASGFTPDEKRRWEYTGRWQIDSDPFHDSFMRYSRKLTPGGLMVIQSIGTLDVDLHPQYLPAVRRQLDANDLNLLEVWRLKKTHGVMLYVAQKNGGDPPPMKTPLTTFHGQSPNREPIEKVAPCSWPWLRRALNRPC